MTFASYKVRKYIPEVDGLRAIAVLLVVTVHMHDKVWVPLNGALGVVIFFVLSGYLITMLALREEKNRGRLDFAAFYIRRSFRIFPAYYLVLAVYAVLILGLRVSPEKAEGFVRSLPYYLFYCQEIPYFHFHSSSFPFYQSWSLGIEEKFYLVWPLLAFGVLSTVKHLRPILTSAIVLALVIGPALTIWARWYALENYAYILMGALLAMVLEDQQGFSLMQRSRRMGLPLVLAGLITLQFSGLYLPPQLYPRLAYALLVAVFLGMLLTSEGVLQRILAMPALVFIGEVSYGIYLVHMLCLNVAEKVFPSGRGLAIPAYVLACALSIAVALILHRMVEKPMIRIGRKLTQRQMGTQMSMAEAAN